jgi:hypothetical protein
MARIARLPSISVLPSLIPALILAPLFLAACSPHAPSAPRPLLPPPPPPGRPPARKRQRPPPARNPLPGKHIQNPARPRDQDRHRHLFVRIWLARRARRRAALARLARRRRSDRTPPSRRRIRQRQGRCRAREYPFHPLGRWQEWQVLADTPGWLSLTALIGIDSGGAHPNYVYAATLWDKAAGQRRKTIDLFTTPAALATAIHTPFCAELQAQRAHKRGGQASLSQPSMDMSEFDTCPDPLAQTLALRADSSAGFDHLVVLIAPYEAGPYAEGTYEIALPVTPALLASVKPQWRNSFTPIRKSGG